MTKMLLGAPVAEQIENETRQIVADLAQKGIVPCLAIVRVGSRSDDVYYEASAIRRATSQGVNTKCFPLAEDATLETLLGVLDAINNDPAIHGCLLLRPLPEPGMDAAARNAISVNKDVDGVTDASIASVFTGAGAGFAPCTAEACIRTLDFYGCPIAGKRAVVVGRSLVVGKPAAMLLLARDASVTICHSKTQDLPAVCRNAELIIASAGKKRMLDETFFSPDQTVVDVGIHADGNSVCGDVDKAVYESVAAITPVPGGLGTVTTAILIRHTAEAAFRFLQQ